MGRNLIKYKITIWYTIILIAVITLFILGMMGFAEYYIAREAKNELQDEVSDFYKEVNKLQDLSSEVLELHYYDDGIVLSIYNDKQELLEGYHPDEFPLETSFVESKVQKVRTQRGLWLALDRSFFVEGEQYWIRGISTLSTVSEMMKKLFVYMVMLVPFFILFAAFIGYRMIRREMEPIYAMTKMADDIAHSADLSLRLPERKAKDELAYLTATFNFMLNNLEDIFQREMQFSGDAAHELRTPISVIMSHCEYCLSELSLTEECKEELELIRKKGVWMSDLVSQLLMIARAENGSYQPEFEETDLKMLVEMVMEELKEKAAERNITLRMCCEAEEILLFCDFNLIMRLLLNLIKNGIQYGREGGYVEVSLYKKKEEDKNGLILSVRDDGIGMDEKEQDKIWDRFYRVDESHSDRQGFGLGLFMVRWIVELHCGWIALKSVPGLGSVFTVWLPEKMI